MRHTYKLWMGTEGMEDKGVHVFDACPDTVRDWVRWWVDFEAEKPGAAMTIDVTGTSPEGIRRLVEVNPRIEPNAAGSELAFCIDTVRHSTVVRDDKRRLSFVLPYVSAVLDDNERNSAGYALRVSVAKSAEPIRISVQSKDELAKKAAHRIAATASAFLAGLDPFRDDVHPMEERYSDIELVLDAFKAA